MLAFSVQIQTTVRLRIRTSNCTLWFHSYCGGYKRITQLEPTQVLGLTETETGVKDGDALSNWLNVAILNGLKSVETVKAEKAAAKEAEAANNGKAADK